nr:autotransporter domain-containing protein [uncultured Methylophaga sp.]
MTTFVKTSYSHKPLSLVSTIVITLLSQNATAASGDEIVDAGEVRNIVTDTDYGRELIVGSSGTGTLNISSGATLTNANEGTIGFLAGSNGSVSVDGAGTSWLHGAGRQLAVGWSGTGELNISNGGSVSNANGFIGARSGGIGTVTVNGAGSTWTNNDQLVIGLEASSGTLSIENGGNVINSNGRIGLSTGSTGKVTVTGTNSTLTDNGSNLLVGLDGNGTLNIIDGGLVTVGTETSGKYDGTLYLAYNAGSTGTLNIGAGASDSADAPGTLKAATVSFGDGTGKLVFNHTSTDYVFSSAITGNGTIDAIAGKTTLTGDTSLFTGSATIASGADLVFGEGSNFNGSIANANSLTFDRSNNSTYSSVISGTGSVTKEGTSRLNLTGINTYTGATIVNAGILSVNGSITNSTTTVNSSGMLGGTGTVGDVFINGGTFAPGNSIGTINVAGNVDFTGGGNYDVEVDAAGNNDKIIATGTATLTSGVVNVKAAPGTYADATDYTVLTATGGLGGTTFSSVNSNLAFLTPTLSYDTNNVFLRLTRNNEAFNSVAATQNQRAVATALDNNTSNLNSLISQITPLSARAAQQAFDSLSGVQHSSNQLLTRSVSSQFNQLLLNRGSQNTSSSLAFNNQMNASGMSSGSASKMLQQRGWWVRGFGSFNEIDDTHNARGADSRTSGLAVGIDADWHDFVVGIAGSYANTDVDAYRGDSTIDSYQTAVYGSWQADEVYINASLGLGLHRVDASRTVIVGSSVSTAKADYDSIDFNGSLESGKDFSLTADTTLTPFAGVTYLHNRRDDFNEKGAGAANLSVDKEDDESLLTSIGLRLSHDIHMKNDRILTPVASVAYVHEHMDSVSQLDASFIGVPTGRFVVDGPDLDKDRLQLDLGLSGQLTEQTSLTVGYTGEFASTHQNNALTATVNMNF